MYHAYAWTACTIHALVFYWHYPFGSHVPPPQQRKQELLVTVVEHTSLGGLSIPQHSSSIFENFDSEQLHAASWVEYLCLVRSPGLLKHLSQLSHRIDHSELVLVWEQQSLVSHLCMASPPLLLNQQFHLWHWTAPNCFSTVFLFFHSALVVSFTTLTLKMSLTDCTKHSQHRNWL